MTTDLYTIPTTTSGRQPGILPEIILKEDHHIIQDTPLVPPDLRVRLHLHPAPATVKAAKPLSPDTQVKDQVREIAESIPIIGTTRSAGPMEITGTLTIATITGAIMAIIKTAALTETMATLTGKVIARVTTETIRTVSQMGITETSVILETKGIILLMYLRKTITR